MNIPFFSVVIPIFNKEKYLSKAIQSVLNQSFTAFELILVLDPSTDKSDEIAKAFKDDRIRIFNRSAPGPGGYAGRNLGILKAKAEWLVFLDADDFWKESHLEAIWGAIEKEADASVAMFCTGYCTERNGTYSETLYYKKFHNQGNHYFDFEKFLLYKPVHTINVAFKKQILEEAGLFPEGLYNRGGDYETWLRVMNLCRKGYWINSMTAVYNKNVEDGVIKSSRPYTFEHPVLIRVRELIKVETDGSIIIALKKYANSFVLTGVRHRMRGGMLTSKDVDALFPEVLKQRYRIWLWRFYAFMPFYLQSIFIKTIQIAR